MAESVGDQFVFTNIIPSNMSRLELYEGYKWLLQRLYDYGHFRERAMALVLNKGAAFKSQLFAGVSDVRLLLRIFASCVFLASPKRAWLTLSMIAETAWKRPAALRDAVTLAFMHKHMYEYMRETSRRLDLLIAELKSVGDAGMLPVQD
jgi:hypothetical protein